MMGLGAGTRIAMGWGVKPSQLLFAAPLVVCFLGAGCGGDGTWETSGVHVGTTAEPLTQLCGAPANGPVQGHDVSSWQGNFNWAAAKAEGVVFGYARISAGLDFVDDRFDANWTDMKANGILRGAYQWFEPGEDEGAQANMMIQKVGRLGAGDLPAMLDVERTGGQSAASVVAKMHRWLDLVEQGTGKRPLIYVGSYFWQDNVNDSSFGNYGLVVPAYGINCPYMPPGWSSWVIWQYSDGNGQLDHDVFNGSLADLQRLAGGGSSNYPRVVKSPPVDVNGDHEADICERGTGGVVCQRSNGTSFPTEIKGPQWSDAAGWAAPEYSSTVQFGDVNGDGKADVCGRASAGMFCELSDGNGFPTEIKGPEWSDAKGWAAPQRYSSIQLADVNGDAKADLCGRDAEGIVCNLADGRGFPTTVRGPAWKDGGGWADSKYSSTIQFPDIDGDGKADVCARAPFGVACYLSDGSGFPKLLQGPAWSDAAGWGAAEHGSTIRFPDIDGDGKSDVCGRAARGIACHLFDGQMFSDVEILGPAWTNESGWSAPQYYATIQYADINGDGKADVCGRAAAGMVCGVSDGKGLSTEVKGPEWSDAKGWAEPKYFTTIGAADVNNDGKDDLCGRAAAGITCFPSTGTGFGAAMNGPGLSDATGWGADPYYSSIRYLGSAHRASTHGPSPDGGNGNNQEADPGSTDPDGPFGGRRAGGCGCVSASNDSQGEAPLAAVVGLIVLAALSRRRTA